MIVASRIVPSQHHSFLLQHLVHTRKDLLSNAVLSQEMAKVEDRGLIGDPPFHRLGPCKAGKQGVSIHISSIKGSEHEKGELLLLQVDQEYHLQWNGRPPFHPRSAGDEASFWRRSARSL